MSTSVTLNEQSIVCRTCLKVLDTTGFTYIDDESAYVKNVGNIREMLQFCIPELDLYVSTQPVICYQCLPILVQVYNFKIKCLNGENIIKAYITRNNLHEYNHVNLNCVLMDDLKQKSQKIQIESRIKHMMLKEIPENEDQAADRHTESLHVMKTLDQRSGDDNCFDVMLTDPEIDANPQDNQGQSIEDDINKTIAEAVDHDINYNSQDFEADIVDIEQDCDINNSSSANEESSSEKLSNIVAVRKDLFENDNESPQSNVDESEKEQPKLILNNGILHQNGRIVIKIDRKKLQSLSAAPTEAKLASDKKTLMPNKSISPQPSITPLQLSTIAPNSLGDLDTPQIVTVETVEGDDEKEVAYNCNKCSYVTSDVIKMYDHNRTYHSFDYTCQHCPFSTSKVELLGKHMTMVHPQNMMPQRNQHFKVTENYACSMCPFSVKNIDLLRSHHLSVHGHTNGEKKGPIVLNSAFTEDTTRSEPRILKRLEYTCDVCPYTTKDKSNLRKHLFTHGTKPLKCDHCTYKCVSPYQLRRHQKQKHAKHLDPRPRNQPYKLPDFKKEKSEAMDNFKITLETIKRELEKEIST